MDGAGVPVAGARPQGWRPTQDCPRAGFRRCGGVPDDRVGLVVQETAAIFDEREV